MGALHAMRNRCHSQRLSAVALTFVLFVAGCAHSPPAPNLPGDSDPKSIHQLAPGPAGQQFLRSVSTYQWGDQSDRITAWFQWIPGAAYGPNPDDRARAAETSHTIAAFLADKIGRGPVFALAATVFGLVNGLVAARLMEDDGAA